MKRPVTSGEKKSARETLTEAYEVRAFRDETETLPVIEPGVPEIAHAEQGAFQKIKSMIKGHGEQTILPDDCQFGDNELCSVES